MVGVIVMLLSTAARPAEGPILQATLTSASATTTTLSSSENPSVYGQLITFTATVSPTDGDGTVDFFADGSSTPISGCGAETLSLVSGTTYAATCETSALIVASHPISATYNGDSDSAPSSGSLAANQVVTAAATTFSVTVNAGSSASVSYGTTATLAESGLPVGATGTVSLQSGPTLCTIILPATSCTTPTTMAASTYSPISATFSDTDGNYSGSTSTNMVSLTVTPADTTTTLSSSVSPSVYGQLVTFTATVSPTDGGGTVSFFADGSTTPINGCGAQPLGGFISDARGFERPRGSTVDAATCQISTLVAGSHPISAVYTGDSNYATSSGDLAGNQVVDPAPLSITASSGSMDYGTAPPTITAGYSGFVLGDGPSALSTPPTCSTTATSSSTVSGSPYPSTCTGAAAANYQISYVDGSVTITPADTTFSVTVNAGSSATVNFGTTATLAESGLPVDATGTVSFQSGPTTLCTITLPATDCTTSAALPVATYSGFSGTFSDTDGNYSGSTSTNTVSLTVNASPTTTSVVSSSENPSVFGDLVTFTATVTPNDGGGTVAFFADGSSTPISGCGAETLSLVSGTTYQATCQTSALDVASHPISATYSGETDYATSSGSLAANQVVTAAATTFSVTVNAGSSATVPFGTTVTLAESGLPSGATGTVSFQSGPTTLCTIILPATSCTTSATLAVGTYTAFPGTFSDTDGNYSGSTSTNTVSLTVTTATPTTTVASSKNPSVFGDLVTFTATVTPDDGGGTVAFFADGSSTAMSGCGAETLSLVSGATYRATCQTSALVVGSHPISATYGGDTSYASSNGSLVANQVVTPAATTFSVTVNAGSSATVSFGTTATLAESGLPSGATGTVSFQSGPTTLCTITLPATSCTTSTTLAVGTYTGFPGTFSDTDGNYSGSTSINTVSLTVTKAATVTTVSSSENPSVFGDPVTFTGTVNPIDGGGTVAFFADGSSTPISGCGAETLSLVSGTTYTATCETSALIVASHPISATYSGDTDYATSSGSLAANQVVTHAATTFSVTVNAGSSATVSYGTTATLAESGLPVGATGTVSFQSGPTLCTIILPATSCTTPTTLAASTYSPISGTFSDTDGNYSGSTSTNMVSLTVTPADTTTTLSSSVSPSVYGQTITFTATVAPTDGGGTVAFFADGSSSAIGGCGAEMLSLVSGTTYRATCQTSALVAGSHPISATYGGDTDYATSSGDLAGNQVVDPAPLSITASSGSMVYGTAPPTITAGYSGFVLGDGPSALSTPPTCSTTATSSSTVSGSPYPSTCTGAAAANYQISYVDGSVTITPADTTFSVTVNAGSSATVNFGTTATLAESGLPVDATGTVSFQSGPTTLCTITLPATDCTTSATLPVATYSDFSGTFSDTDGNYSGSTSTNTVSLTVNALPGSPLAVNSSYSTAYAATLSVSAAAGVLNGDTVNGATIFSNTDTAHGDLTLNADGSFTYVPNSTFSGNDAFSYMLENAFGTSSATVTISVAPPPVVNVPPLIQISGSDAIGTSIALSNREYPTSHSAGAVVLARDDFFSDALAGGPLAAAKDGPLLLTQGASESAALDPRVLAEIQRVLPAGRTVYVLGGTGALSGGIDTTLKGLGYVVVREAGADEYATAVDIAQQLGNPSTILEATGLSFFDALSAVPAAVADHAAILLTDGATQAPETAAYLSQHRGDVRFAIGGSFAAYGADPTATPVFGQDLFETSTAVANRFFPNASDFGIATDTDFADAVSGGVFMATRTPIGPILLVSPTGSLPPSVVSYLGSLSKATQGYVAGGQLAVPPAVVAALHAAVG